MSRDGSTELLFLDGETYVFRLAWKQLIKLQESRLCGPFVVFNRLHGEDWMLEDVAEVIRLGLVGGGLSEIQARKLVREYVETRQPMREKEPSPLGIARTVIAAGLLGPPDEEILEKKRGSGERIDDLDNGRIRIAAVYGIGALIGFTAADIDQMSLWQFSAQVLGWSKQFEKDSLMSESEKDEVWEWLQEKELPLSLREARNEKTKAPNGSAV